MSERLQALGPRHHAAIRLKLDGAAGSEIADALDVQTRTVYLWMGEPLVKEEQPGSSTASRLAPSKQRVGGSSPPGGIAEGRFESGMAAIAAATDTIQEFLGHADAKTTQIYAHYAPSEHEVAMVNAAFSAKESTGSNSGSNLSETGANRRRSLAISDS